jgi:hypothetical protein
MTRYMRLGALVAACFGAGLAWTPAARTARPPTAIPMMSLENVAYHGFLSYW